MRELKGREKLHCKLGILGDFYPHCLGRGGREKMRERGVYVWGETKTETQSHTHTGRETETAILKF
jgi:hypothetical protein